MKQNNNTIVPALLGIEPDIDSLTKSANAVRLVEGGCTRSGSRQDICIYAISAI